MVYEGTQKHLLVEGMVSVNQTYKDDSSSMGRGSSWDSCSQMVPMLTKPLLAAGSGSRWQQTFQKVARLHSQNSLRKVTMTSGHLQCKQKATEKVADQWSHQMSWITLWNRMTSKNVKAILWHRGGNILHHCAVSLILCFCF